MKNIHVEGVTKRYPNGVVAVDAVDLTVEAGEFLVLVGPSGCGKTTLLRMLAGLETVTSGRIILGDVDITRQDPRHRDIAMVFQDYALYPQMTVAQNLGFALRMRKTPRAEIERRTAEVAEVLGLTALLDRRPHALSGGQRQRVALGRAMVREPSAFLMDEPLSNLDAKLRGIMRGELARLHARLGVTTVYVTHDQVEAMTLGHRVAVMSDGRVQQCATPREVYGAPANLFVAAFMGSPPMNLFVAGVEGDVAVLDDLRVPLPRGVVEGRTVVVGLRPSAIGLAPVPSPGSQPIRVEVVEELGDERLVGFSLSAPAPAVDSAKAAGETIAPGDERLLADASGTAAIAKLPAGEEIQVGDPMHATIQGDAHLFDAQTGEAVAIVPAAAMQGAESAR